MRARFLSLLITVLVVCSFAFASDSGKKSAACCDQKAHATKASLVKSGSKECTADMKECLAKGAKMSKECTDAEKANCPMMKGSKTAMKTSMKMDCCKGKDTKTTDAGKTKQESKDSNVKGME
jgi:hypothetical protein